jgi:circadian clock protein KaiC
MTSPPRMSTGIEGLDDMLRGGFVPGRPYLISGGAGSGKTTLGIQFLQQGVKQGERALFVSIDEPPVEVRENVRSLGWDVGKIRILDVHPSAKAYSRKVSLVEVGAQRSVGSLREATTDGKAEALKQVSPDLSAQTLQLMLRQEFGETRYSRVVIDSLTSLRRMAAPDEDPETSIGSLFRFLSESGVTALLVADLPDFAKLEIETFLCRGEVRLHKVMSSTKIERFVTVEKFRGSGHDTLPRPMTITKAGIGVASTKKVAQAILKTLQSVPTASAR